MVIEDGPHCLRSMSLSLPRRCAPTIDTRLGVIGLKGHIQRAIKEKAIAKPLNDPNLRGECPSAFPNAEPAWVVAVGQRPLFGSHCNRRDHHVHGFQLVHECYHQPPTAFPGSTSRYAGDLGVRSVDGQGREFHQKADA